MLDDPEDPVRAAYEKGGSRPVLKVVGGQRSDSRPPFELHPARLPDPASIPPRRWLYGTQLVRGYVSVLVAPGGTGKSAYAMGVGLALVSGRALLGEHIFEPVNVAIINLDDNLEELERRVAALMIKHNVTRTALEGRLFLDDGDARGADVRGLTIAAIGPDGFTVVEPDVDALIEQIRKHNIGAVICDPFAESHSLEENSNPMMIKASAAWRRVARATGCAVLLVHHVRKGEQTGIDASRGAKALTDSARVGLLMSTMSPDDAAAFGIEEDERWQYVRIDDAKRNMAPARSACWMKLEPVALGNTALNRLYPAGDSVQAIVPWQPQSIWQRTAPADLNTALDRIKAGVRPGVPYGPDRRGGSTRWVGQALVEVLGIDDKQAAQMVAAWFKSGLLYKAMYEDKKEGRESPCVKVNDTKRPTI